jgi:predicted  nucleic acid-binding Zn-ribbon protein
MARKRIILDPRKCCMCNNLFTRNINESRNEFNTRDWCSDDCKIKKIEKGPTDHICKKCGKIFKSKINRTICYKPKCYIKNFGIEKKNKNKEEWTNTEKKNICAFDSFRKKALNLGISPKEAALVSMEVVRKCNMRHDFKDWDEEEIREIRKKVEEANGIN